MTEVFQRLTDAPRTDIDRGSLTPSERQDVRSITVKTGQSSASPGAYTTVYYVTGDERLAVKKFVDENTVQLKKIDFSKHRNAVQSSVSREIYDLILHELGIRELKTFNTVVLETRQDGTQWIVDRLKFDNRPNSRYRPNTTGTARVPPNVSLFEVFSVASDVISEDCLRSTDLEFDIRQVLDYFRSEACFPCYPISLDDGQLAVEKYSNLSELKFGVGFARSYGIYDDPWKVVQEYQRVHTERNKDPSSSVPEIAQYANVKTSRARDWLNDNKTPAVIKGLEKARSFGWIDIDEPTTTFNGLNILVAWIFSGGGISRDTFSPTFLIEDDHRQEILVQAFERVEVDFRILREKEPGRSREARPVEGAAILGRILAVLGAPVGVKSENEYINLPAYLHLVPAEIQRDFARVYVMNRGVALSAKSQTRSLVVHEQRPKRYLKELMGLFSISTSEQVTLDTENNKLYLSENAIHALFQEGDRYRLESV